jgi:hypothetical protein
VNGQYTAQAKAVVDDAADANVVFLDLYSAMLAVEEVERRSFFTDGLHFTPEGNHFVFDKLVKLIESQWPSSLTVAPCKVSCDAVYKCFQQPRGAERLCWRPFTRR